MDTDALILVYSQFQAAQSCSEATITDRATYLRALVRRTGKALLEMTRHDLIADQARPHLSPNTRAHNKSYLYGFFTWMQDEGYRLDNPAARLPRSKMVKPEPNPIATEDIEYLLHSGIYGRTRLYVLLYAYQGFRPVEIAAVAGEHIDWEHERIWSAEGKGGKHVWRPIAPIVWGELQKYPRSGYLFESQYKPGEHVSRKSVSNTLSKALKRAGIIHRPHDMRAWFATEQLNAGSPQIVVQAALRHTDSQSIEHYYRPSDQKVRESMDKLPRVQVPSKTVRKRAA